MCHKVLNIAAGLLPIVASDLQAETVYNYDPLDSVKKLDSKWIGVFAGLIHDSTSDIVYFTDENAAKTRIAVNSIDLLISISPYGFTLVTPWIDEKLKVGAQIIVAANCSNPLGR